MADYCDPVDGLVRLRSGPPGLIPRKIPSVGGKSGPRSYPHISPPFSRRLFPVSEAEKDEEIIMYGILGAILGMDLLFSFPGEENG